MGDWNFGPRERGHGAQPLFHEMSAQQRAASMDAIVRQIASLTEAHNVQTEFYNALKSEVSHMWMQTTNAPRFSSLSARLRWLVLGR